MRSGRTMEMTILRIVMTIESVQASFAVGQSVQIRQQAVHEVA